VLVMNKAVAAAKPGNMHFPSDLTSLEQNLFNQGYMSLNSQGLFGGNTVQSNQFGCTSAFGS